MQILEQKIVGKRGPAWCEDALVITPDFIAVIDGSTSKSQLPPLAKGWSGGMMAAKLVKEVIESMPADITLQAFVLQVNQLFQQYYIQAYGSQMLSNLQQHKENRWTCSVILYNRNSRSIWMIGDCLALLVNADGTMQELTNEKPYEHRLATERAAVLHRQLTVGNVTVDDLRKHDMGRDQIIPAMLQEMKNQNVTYAVLDGFDIAWQHVKVVSNITATTLILASDGYPKLFPTLDKTESYLQDCLNQDPLMINRHLATKAWMQGTNSFDDRTYVRFLIS